MSLATALIQRGWGWRRGNQSKKKSASMPTAKTSAKEIEAPDPAIRKRKKTTRNVMAHKPAVKVKENTTATDPADPGWVAGACADADVGMIAKELIDRKFTKTAVKQRIASAMEIRDIFATGAAISHAIDIKAADQFIQTGASVEYVRDHLWNVIVDNQSPEINTSHQPRFDEFNERQRISESWDRANEMVHGDNPPPPVRS
jgi:hypothetical protein